MKCVKHLIKQYCFEGWPEKHMLSTAIKPYWSDRGQLTIVQNTLLKSSRVVIPSSMCLEVLDKIHEGHQGITKCRERAKQAVWWPGLSKQIQDMVENCRVCLQHKVNHPEPLNPTPSLTNTIEENKAKLKKLSAKRKRILKKQSSQIWNEKFLTTKRRYTQNSGHSSKRITKISSQYSKKEKKLNGIIFKIQKKLLISGLNSGV